MSMPTVEQLKRAIQIQEQIVKLEAEMKAILGGVSILPASKSAPVSKPTEKKRTMSPEARERIAAAQRARWAKTKGTSATTVTAASPKTSANPKKRRTMSAEARAKISAAAKKRWAKKKG